MSAIPLGDATVRSYVRPASERTTVTPVVLPGFDDHLRDYPRFHVRLRWRDSTGEVIELPGPVCIGAGRFYGLGLFVATRCQSP